MENEEEKKTKKKKKKKKRGQVDMVTWLKWINS